jgi:hypothetical protein
MEIILALVVVIAVIIFGALLSMGNERQRRAIDGLREQVVLWAMQDLTIKREKFEREAIVDDPLVWLNRVVTKVTGSKLVLEVDEFFDEPQALVCRSRDAGKVVLTPLSPTTLRQKTQGNRARLSQVAVDNPLLSLPRGTQQHEISVLNGGMLFDLELPLAWKAMTGQQVEHMDRLWLYIIPD